MTYDMILPEMGESVQEARLVKWLKSVGDTVEEDEIILEIATDKVDSEIPSPVAGKILELKASEGDMVQISSIIAVIESDLKDKSKKTSPTPYKTEKMNPNKEKVVSKHRVLTGANSGFFSPLVKRIAKAEGLLSEELSSLQGTGRNNRLTKTDILHYLKNRQFIVTPTVQNQAIGHFPHHIDPVKVKYDPERVTIEKMSTMRKGIAKHMVQSLYTAPHVFSIHEVNMKIIWDWRNSIKDRFKKKYGFNLTLTHILMQEVAKAIQKNPKINSSIEGDSIIIRHDINLGMAVGYTAKNGDNALMVPVISNIDKLSLKEIAEKASEAIKKTINHQLKPDDMANGTFTVTNVGTFGTEVGLGIINQPQVAILSFGGIVKRPIVAPDDSIQVATMMKMALCYDHRAVDGMLAGQFLSSLQSSLENYEADSEIVF